MSPSSSAGSKPSIRLHSAHERISGDLRLHADEMLDGGVHVAPLATQEALASEDRAVQRAHIENPRAHSAPCTSDSATGRRSTWERVAATATRNAS